MITIAEATQKDHPIIIEIAYQTWPIAYGEILSKQQLDYMLHTFYSEDALKESVTKKGHRFLIAKESDISLGFASYEINCNQTNKTKIHKIYILPNSQSRGVGKLLLNEVENIAVKNENSTLFLNVNRFNKAIQFYQKMGFEIVGEENIVLDHGYLMEDYIMEKRFDSI